MGTITLEMFNELMEKVSTNGDLIKKSEQKISDQITIFETKYDQALADLERKHKAEISEIKDQSKAEIGELKKELNSIRELIEGKSENIKLSDKAVEGAVKQVATTEFNKLNTKVYNACEKNNSLEQYTRNWCVRIYGLEVSKEREAEVGPVKAAMEAAFNNIVKPVLVKVVDHGGAGLSSVPELEYCIENAHKLGKEFHKNGKTLPPCIIVRFMKREIRDLVMRNRKFVPSPTVAQVTAGVEQFRVVDDLTQINHARRTALIADARVEKVWTIQGNFRVILKDDPNKTVFKCKGSSVNVEDLLSKLS